MPYCSNCGNSVEDIVRFCSSCGSELNTSAPATQPVQQPAQGLDMSSLEGTVESHLTKSILTTLFCCLPLGVIAIVFSSICQSKLNSGDFDGAVSASNTADTLGNVSIGLGIFGLILNILLSFGGM